MDKVEVPTKSDRIYEESTWWENYINARKKTDEESINKQEVLTNMITLCDGCYLMEHCGQCNPDCRLRQAIDMIEKIPPTVSKMHFVNDGDKDYPMPMILVNNRERYRILKIDGVYFVPLMDVIDDISCIKSDVTIVNGIKYCSHCRQPIRNEVMQNDELDGE